MWPCSCQRARYAARCYGSFGKGTLLHFASRDGGFDVSRHQDDADDDNGSAAAGDDEVHADFVRGDVHHLSNLFGTCRVHFDEQLGWHWAAVVFEPDASVETDRQDSQEQEGVGDSRALAA